MLKRSILAFACMLLLSTAAYANHYSDTYVIPVVGHVAGANGTMWMTDVAIRNFRTTPIDIDLIIIDSGFDTTDNVHPLVSDTVDGTVTVPANATVLLKDIMKGYRGLSGATGSLIIGSDLPFAVTSRTYNNSVPLGQTVPATANFLVNSFGNADNTAFAYIPGIVDNATTRTNVGFTAGSGAANGDPMIVEITIRNATGAVVGTRSISIPSGSFMHAQVPVGSLLQAGSSLDLGSADFRVVSGEGAVVPYASIIDNATSVASYVMGQFPDPVTSTTSFSFRPPSVFRMLLDRGISR